MEENLLVPINPEKSSEVGIPKRKPRAAYVQVLAARIDELESCGAELAAWYAREVIDALGEADGMSKVAILKLLADRLFKTSAQAGQGLGVVLQVITGVPPALVPVNPPPQKLSEGASGASL